MACALPPFVAVGGAMRFNVGAVDGCRFARPSSLGQSGQHLPPKATPRPPVKAVVDRGARTVLRRASRQRQPEVRTCRMPERIIRSSFPSGPGWLIGMNGSITTHCASESQNRSAIAASMRQTVRLNHKIKPPQNLGSVQTLKGRLDARPLAGVGSCSWHRGGGAPSGRRALRFNPGVDLGSGRGRRLPRRGKHTIPYSILSIMSVPDTASAVISSL